MAAEFLRRGHPENTDPAEAVDHFPRNVRLSIDRRGIELSIEKCRKLFESLIELRLLRRRDPRIRHHPIGDEMPGEQSLGKPERLRAGEEQLLGLLHFLLSLDFGFGHGK